jgi:hypothetical protein
MLRALAAPRASARSRMRKHRFFLITELSHA